MFRKQIEAASVQCGCGPYQDKASYPCEPEPYVPTKAQRKENARMANAEAQRVNTLSNLLVRINDENDPSYVAQLAEAYKNVRGY